MTWNIRWRVRDWNSCVSPCKMALDDNEVVSPPQVSVRKNMEFDKREDNSINLIHNKTLSLPSKKYNKRRQLNNPIDIDKDGVTVGNRVDDSSWSLSADEDYIVFSFDVVKDCKSLKSEANRGIGGNHKNSRPVNRKLEYGEDGEQVSDRNTNIHEKRSNANMRDTNQQDQDNITHFKEDVKKEICLSRNQQREIIVRACQIEKIEDLGMSTESRDSNQSEDSTCSFAFPV
ncbi:hypothetical protein SESBI_09112 [Sesbania bispinosa]|nr:hypothetical protein SESBI_09112 [Sesbania bispinosa]